MQATKQPSKNIILHKRDTKSESSFENQKSAWVCVHVEEYTAYKIKGIRDRRCALGSRSYINWIEKKSERRETYKKYKF